jgi:CheY-like chemotaxis protein
LFAAETKTVQQMGPQLQRVLICDPQPASAQLISELMRNIARSQAWIASNAEKAMRIAGTADPQIIFVEMHSETVDGIDFTRKLRRGNLSCRQAPVIMVTGSATAADILAARDAGVHEFLRKPFAMKDLLRRLEAVTIRQRDWVEAVGYVGPDRRRFNSGDYSGPLKRRADNPATPDTARIGQALKILRSAATAIEADPAQAMRSMITQAVELQKAASATSDMGLSMASADLHRFLAQAAKSGAPLDRAEVDRYCVPLMAFMPKDAEARGAQAA